MEDDSVGRDIESLQPPRQASVSKSQLDTTSEVHECVANVCHLLLKPAVSPSLDFPKTWPNSTPLHIISHERTTRECLHGFSSTNHDRSSMGHTSE